MELLIRKSPRLAGPVRIENWFDPRPLVFDNCDFKSGFFARGARIDHDIIFIDCTFGPLTGYAGCKDIALEFSNARIRGDLLLFNCEVKGRLFAPGLKAKSNVRLQGCRIAPANWNIEPIKAHEVLAEIDSRLDGFRPKNGAKEQDTTLVVFDNARVGGHFEIFSAGTELARRINADEPLYNPTDYASLIAGKLSCKRIEVEGNITLSDSVIFGPVLFNASRVTGNFTLRRTRLPISRDEKATVDRLTLNRAKVARKLELNNAEIRGGVSLYGVTVEGACDVGGLHCNGDLNLSFSTIGHLRAYRTATDKLADRESLKVGGSLILSAATVGVLELRGATIQRNLIAQTGDFGVFTLSLGAQPWIDGKDVYFWPKRCSIGAVSLTSIQVRETFDASAIQLIPFALPDPNKEKRQDFELLNSEINGALVFFGADDLVKQLAIIWTDAIPTDKWRNPDTKEYATPSTSEFPSRISGNLSVRACRIGGDLDLKNVRLTSGDGGIVLNNTSVGLNLKASSVSESSNPIETHCRYFDAEELSCQGEVDLSGLRVGKETVLDPTGQSATTSRSNIPSIADAIWPSGDQSEGSNLEVDKKQVGSISLRGAHIAGDLLLARTNKEKNDSLTEATGFADIRGNLDLTAVRCEKLVFSGNNFIGLERSHTGNKKKEPRAILERGYFSQVKILDWPQSHWILVRIWNWFRGKARSIPQPINLQHATIGKWAFGSEGKQFAQDCVRILKEMRPEDRSTWIGVESELRNQSYEWQADRVYLAMVWSSKLRLREERNILLRLPSFLWHLVVYWAQRCFLWAKVVFGVPLAIAFITLFGLSFLFTESSNVRATVGYLHALPTQTRMEMPEANEIHPSDLGVEWNKWDAFALAVRYHVPLFESRTHDRWEASEDEACVRGFHLGVKMETIAFAVEVTYWVMLPILLLGFVAWAFRKREAD